MDFGITGVIVKEGDGDFQPSILHQSHLYILYILYILSKKLQCMATAHQWDPNR